MDETKNSEERLIIIGGGPAALSAALYAARAQLNPLVFTGLLPGGQAAMTNVIENYPGFPDGIGGSELTDLFAKQAVKFGARLANEEVTAVDFTHSPFTVTTYKKQFGSKAVILATGANPSLLSVPGEKELTGKGVSYCATCDGWFFRGKNLIVVGGGDSAVEEAIFLTRFAESVTIVHRRDTLRAGAILQERAKKEPKIHFIWNSVITRINGSETVTGASLKNVQTGQESEVPIHGVFVFIGHQPNTSIFQKQIALDEKGFIKIDSKYQTNVPGIFAAGEVCDPHYRQVITSAGMGAAAAIEATHFLEK
jgi:thioredoxin reductase (NADPH)